MEGTGQGNADGAGNLEIRMKAKPGAKGNPAKAADLFAGSRFRKVNACSHSQELARSRFSYRPVCSAIKLDACLNAVCKSGPTGKLL